MAAACACFRASTPKKMQRVSTAARTKAGLAERLERRTAELKKNAAELRIIIKPSFMLGYHSKDRSIITDPELLTNWEVLREHGYSNVFWGMANIYDRFFGPAACRTCGVLRNEACGMPIVSASDDQVAHTYMRGMAQSTISQT